MKYRLYTYTPDNTEYYIDCRHMEMVEGAMMMQENMFPGSTYRLEIL